MTAACDDLTARFVSDLADPAQYVRVGTAPVFKAHRAWKTVYGADGKALLGPDGKPRKRLVVVDDARLKRIAANMAAAERLQGAAARLIPGHTLPGNATPEGEQPEPWGYAKNPRVGKWGPRQETGLLLDYYVRRDKVDEARTYPFRSPEFYGDSDEITAVSFLRRDPELDLGILSYARGRGPCCYYVSENAMPDFDDLNKGGDDGGMGGEAGPPPGYDEWSKHMDYACGNHPVMKYAAEQQAAANAPPPPPPMPMPMPPAADGPPGLPPAPDQFGRQHQPTRYERDLLSRMEAAEKKAADAERRERHQSRRGRLVQYQQAGVLFDLEEEFADCKDLDADQYAKFERRLTRYEREPRGREPIPVATSGEGGGRAEFGQRELDRATQYMRQHPGCESEDAEEYARGERGLNGKPVAAAR